MRCLWRRSGALVLTMIAFAPAAARPGGPRLVCETYPDIPVCSGEIVSCVLCHTAAPALNPYGLSVALALTGPYDDTLPAALSAVEGNDADNDGLSNLEELVLGTWPGDPQSHWVSPPPPSGPANPRYQVGAYDAAFAYRRMKGQYCGQSPSFDEMQALASSPDPTAFIRQELAVCLSSDYWKNEALHRLADKRIRPLQAVGAEGVIPLADYRWDYRLFSYVLSDGRDARDLLLADYHVDENGTPVEGTFQDGDIGQPLDPTYRAGMITTQWFLMIHTMFSELPRTTAAQAYRAYLGQDIALSEGLLPVDGEPVDVDSKGVAAPACAVCHSTLDPLAYSFAYYGGIQGPDTGAFLPNRPSWSPGDVSASLLDTPLSSIHTAGVVPWAETAANSDLFARTIAEMFFQHALGPPTPDDQAELEALWRGLADHEYSANALIEDLVQSDAFGVP